METAVAIAILGLVATTGLETLLTLNKNAFSTRVMTEAREIVQRNMELAVGAPFTSTNLPSNHILDLTAAASPFPHWDENGGTADVIVYTSRTGTEAPLTGTLTRRVVAEPNSLGADIRRVTFHLDYGDRPTQPQTIFNRALSYEMTTLRAADQ